MLGAVSAPAPRRQAAPFVSIVFERDNRPFLRCMHGFGLCLWRLGRFEEAERVFDRMLWLNPSDNQGVRFLIDEVRSKTAWEDRREER